MTRLTLGPDENGLDRVIGAAVDTDTPFYIYDTEVFGARAAALRDALPGDLYYSAKANPHPALLAAAVTAGCGVEVASLGELEAIRSTGIDPARSILVGPAKSRRLLTAVVDCGVSIVVVESERELRRLVEVVANGSCSTRVMLRLSLPGARGMLRMSGHQFGMDHTDVLSCHKLLATVDKLTFVGYHGYLASQLLNPTDIAHNARLVLDAAAELTGLGFPATLVDLGGGFGIGYTDDDETLDLNALRLLLRGVQSAISGPRLMFESGRYLAGPAGALVCRVVEVKTIGARRFVLLDGGINASGLFGGGNGLRGLRHSVVRNGALVTGGAPTNICGPLCTPMDRLATGVPCPADVDDLVVWWNMGAYGFTAAPVNFLSFPHPIEVLT